VIRNEEMMRSNKFQCLLCPNAIFMLVMSIMQIMRNNAKLCGYYVEMMRKLCVLCRNYATIMLILCGYYAEIMRELCVLCKNYAEIMRKLCEYYAEIMRKFMRKLCGNYVDYA